MHLFSSFGAWRLARQVAVLLTALGVGHVMAQQPPLVAPTQKMWSAGDGFVFEGSEKKVRKLRQSLSGIACAPNAAGKIFCLAGFDEGSSARFAELDVAAQKVLPLPEAIPLLGDSTGELDAEAAATDGRFFYVTGSHSNKRSDCRSNPDSRHIVRLRRDESSGLLSRTASGGYVNFADSGRLWDTLAQLPAMRPLLDRCLGDEPNNGREAGGINIEGLAVHGGRLFFGLRGPVQSGAAWVVSVDAEALFSKTADPKPALYRLALGPHRGIRDMVAVEGGVLILAGPDDADNKPEPTWTVALWDGRAASPGPTEAAFDALKNGNASLPPVSTPRNLAVLDLSSVTTRACDKEVKPEAITVLQTTAKNYRVLVLSDGLCDGGALLFDVPR